MPELHSKLRCFLALPADGESIRIRRVVEKCAKETGFKIVCNSDVPSGLSKTEALVGELTQSDCIIADVSENSANVFFEIGMAQAMGKSLFLLVRKDRFEGMPFDLRELHLYPYSLNGEGLVDLEKRLARDLHTFKKSPRRPSIMVNSRMVTPFFVDWNRLERAETENLCRELLAQMGFQKVDWIKESREIDLVAELPKRDPDGFEYREVWLVAMGRNVPLEMVLDQALKDPERLIRRVFRSQEHMERVMARSNSHAPITLLCISLEDTPRQQLLFELSEHRSQPRFFRGTDPIRVRVWDRNYLTTLVKQFRQIAYKYFSDEGRAKSLYRKSPDELYQENVALTERLSSALESLEDEKNRRVRAERDAVWKDISFTTAHKIGNPLFAIETFLDPLEKRVSEKRTDEARAIMERIRAAIERAKGIVEQFKSLTRAQELTPIAILLQPLLEESCRVAQDRGVNCKVDCPPDAKILGDPGRLSECFEELTSNAMRWLNKPQKHLEIAVETNPTPLPREVDSTQRFLLIHFKDNGQGIPPESKSRIFDAFYTTHDQGTGLGLALVRRIIEGHGGIIYESGSFQSGADFEIYLPKADDSTTTSNR
jgi:signal transduction histidine kinase